MKIAIQPDQVIHRNGEHQSFSERWTELAQDIGVTPVPVDVFAKDVVTQIAKCDAFMWRCPPSAHPRQYAKRLLPALEQGLGIPVFPTWKTSWHFEDKIGQHYLLAAASISQPTTYVCWTAKDAEAFCDVASYPFVVKLTSGYQSKNVRLIHNRKDAQFYIDHLFGPGLTGLGYDPAGNLRKMLRRFRAATQIAKGRYTNSPSAEIEPQHGYFIAQEFLPRNAFDTRVTVIGNRAFAFRRFNRDDDFRASGSGRNDWNADKIDESAIRLAFQTSKQINAQTVAVDLLRKTGRYVVVELTLSYASWAVRNCPGHWTLEGEPASGPLHWHAGSLRPEDAIFEDFIKLCRHEIS